MLEPVSEIRLSIRTNSHDRHCKLYNLLVLSSHYKSKRPRGDYVFRNSHSELYNINEFVMYPRTAGICFLIHHWCVQIFFVGSSGFGEKSEQSQYRCGWSRLLYSRHVRLFGYLNWWVGLTSIHSEQSRRCNCT